MYKKHQFALSKYVFFFPVYTIIGINIYFNNKYSIFKDDLGGPAVSAVVSA